MKKYKVIYADDYAEDQSQIIETEYVRVVDGILFLESKDATGTKADGVFREWKRIIKVEDK